MHAFQLSFSGTLFLSVLVIILCILVYPSLHDFASAFLTLLEESYLTEKIGSYQLKQCMLQYYQLPSS